MFVGTYDYCSFFTSHRPDTLLTTTNNVIEIKSLTIFTALILDKTNNDELKIKVGLNKLYFVGFYNYFSQTTH